MAQQESRNRTAWLVAGVLVGLGIALFWPHEQGLATTADRSDKFAIATVPAGLGSSDAVFILDFLTGQLRGAVLNNNTGTFTNFYVRNLADDFLARPNAPQPRFAFATGSAAIPSRGPATMANGVVYVAELNSGRCVAYGFPYNQVNAVMPPVNLIPLDQFQFREVTN